MGKLKGMVPFIKEDDINEMVIDLAKQIERDYEGKQIVIICPLKGSILFCADLVRKLSLPVVVDFVYLTSPKGESVRIIKDVTENLFQKDVLIVEEIIDAGRTLSFFKRANHSFTSQKFKICTLLDKPARRELPVRPDYVGRTIDDRYLIGYGLDSEEIGRNYKDIYNFAQ